MATVKLYDSRDPMTAGREAFEMILSGDDVVVGDRAALSHAFFDATAHLAGAWADFADVMNGALMTDDPVAARKAVLARREVSEAQRIADLLLGVMWEASPGVAAAEAALDES